MQNKRFSNWLDSLLRWGYGALPFYLGALGLGWAVLVGIWQYRGRLWRSPIVCWLALVAAGMVFQSRFAYAPHAAWVSLHHFIPYFLLFSVLLPGLRTVESCLGIAETLLLMSIPVNLAGIVEYGLKFEAAEAVLAGSPLLSWLYQVEHYHRSVSLFGNANVYAAYLTILLGLGLGLMQHWQTRPQPTPSGAFGRRWLWVAIALIPIGIFCAGSRNGWAVAIAEIGLMMAMSWRSWRVQMAGILSIAALLISAAIGGIGTYDLTFESLISSVVNDSRMNTWSVAWRLIQSRPWQGWGMGSFQHLYPIMNSRMDYLTMAHAHNVGLMLWVEMGGVLAIALMLPIGYTAYRGGRAYLLQETSPSARFVLRSYLLALWGVLLFSLFDVPFYDPRINALNWLVFAGVYRLSRL